MTEYRNAPRCAHCGTYLAPMADGRCPECEFMYDGSDSTEPAAEKTTPQDHSS